MNTKDEAANLSKAGEVNKELLSYFETWLNSHSKKSKATVDNIKRDVEKFVEFLGDQEVSSITVRSYIDEIEEHYRASSFVSKLSSIRQFVNWLNLKDNPFGIIRSL